MGEEVAATGERRFSTGPRLVWALIGLLVLIVIFIVAWTYLQWSIAEQVYLLKSGLDWFGITFYHNFTFVAAALFALLVINPRPGHSDISSLVTTFSRRLKPYEEFDHPRETKIGKWLWLLWQVMKWSIVFGLFVAAGGF